MIKRLILKLISLYQRNHLLNSYLFRVFFMSDQSCRFLPTCSQYTYQAVEKYGSIKGLWLGLKRIVRCHPWNKGGFDPIP